jgi:hypothetical protein
MKGEKADANIIMAFGAGHRACIGMNKGYDEHVKGQYDVAEELRIRAYGCHNKWYVRSKCERQGLVSFAGWLKCTARLRT